MKETLLIFDRSLPTPFGTRDQKRFYHIAFGSFRKCQAILELHEESRPEIEQLADVLAAHIYKLIRS